MCKYYSVESFKNTAKDWRASVQKPTCIEKKIFRMDNTLLDIIEQYLSAKPHYLRRYQRSGK